MGGGLKDVHKRKYDRVGVLQKAWLMPRGEILSFKQFYLHRQAFILKCKKIRSKTKITTFSHASEAQLPPLFSRLNKKARERCILHMHANLSITYRKPFPRTRKAEVLSKTASTETGITTAKTNDKKFLICSETLAAQGRNPLLDILSFLSFLQNKPNEDQLKSTQKISLTRSQTSKKPSLRQNETNLISLTICCKTKVTQTLKRGDLQ